MKFIALGNGRVTLVDADVYAWASQVKWHYSGGYASRNGKHVNGKRMKSIKLHRLIMNCPDGMQVDHINGDTLDNRRTNLRVCTLADNMKNYRTPRNNSSGYRGVNRHWRSKKWRAYIMVAGKQKHLGEFESKEDAARAYNQAALEIRGAFAKLNEIRK